MITDYHIHTAYSDDSEYPMDQVVADAIALGLEEICITDHVDYGIKRDWDDPAGFLYRKGEMGEAAWVPLHNVDYPRYVTQIQQLQAQYQDKIRIKLGLEFGMQQHTIPQFRQLYSRYPFDFILLSVHQVEDMEFWSGRFQQGRSQAEYNLRYYQEILALVEACKDYSVLAHLDMIIRYDRAGIYPFEKLKPILTQILKTVIADGKGIEVNTSCFRYGLPDLTPSRDVLKLYRDLGGRVLTIGSDSHRPGHLGAGIRQTMEQLKTMGFTHICTYEKMNPIFHSL